MGAQAAECGQLPFEPGTNTGSERKNYAVLGLVWACLAELYILRWLTPAATTLRVTTEWDDGVHD